MIQFTKGQKVKNQYGETLTVMDHVDCVVWVYESSQTYHPTKAYPIK